MRRSGREWRCASECGEGMARYPDRAQCRGVSGRGAVVCHGPLFKTEDRVDLLRVCTESVVDRRRTEGFGCWAPGGKRVGWVARRCDPRCWIDCEFLKSPPGLGVWFFLVDESLEAKRAAGCGLAERPSFFFYLARGTERSVLW